MLRILKIYAKTSKNTPIWQNVKQKEQQQLFKDVEARAAWARAWKMPLMEFEPGTLKIPTQTTIFHVRKNVDFSYCALYVREARGANIYTLYLANLVSVE